MQHQKIKMSQKRFRIGELAQELKVKKFVIRFWEKEFDFASDRSQGGQRFYTAVDLEVFLTIKDLLYNQGYTIAGAKAQLLKSPKENSPLSASTRALSDQTFTPSTNSSMVTPAHHELPHQKYEQRPHTKLPEHFVAHIQEIREKIIKLKAFLR